MQVQESAPALSEGEKQALRLVAQGFNSKEIARKLHISEHTVDQRVRTSLRKLHVSSRHEAARLLVRTEGETTQIDTYQPLIYQPKPLVPGPQAAPFTVQPQGDEHRSRLTRLLLRIMSFGPPIGGSINELSADGRILAMIRAAAMTAVGVVTLVLLIAGTFAVLS